MPRATSRTPSQLRIAYSRLRDAVLGYRLIRKVVLHDMARVLLVDKSLAGIVAKDVVLHNPAAAAGAEDQAGAVLDQRRVPTEDLVGREGSARGVGRDDRRILPGFRFGVRVDRVAGEYVEHARPGLRAADHHTFSERVLEPVVLNPVEVRLRAEPESHLVAPVVVHGVRPGGRMLQPSARLRSAAVRAELVLDDVEIVVVVAEKLILQVADEMAAADRVRGLRPGFRAFKAYAADRKLRDAAEVHRVRAACAFEDDPGTGILPTGDHEVPDAAVATILESQRVALTDHSDSGVPAAAEDVDVIHLFEDNAL